VPRRAWHDRFSDLGQKLTRRYGPATARRLFTPGRCQGDAFDPCARGGSLHLRLHWQWPDGQRISLTLGQARHRSQPDDAAALRLEYFRPPGAGVEPAAL
jgi:hypothetical protein